MHKQHNYAYRAMSSSRRAPSRVNLLKLFCVHFRQDTMANDRDWDNDILREVFRQLHDKVVDAISVDDVISKLLAGEVISSAENRELTEIVRKSERCRQLLAKLHTSDHPRAFVELKTAIGSESAYSWLVELIEQKYGELTADSVRRKRMYNCHNSRD